MSTERKVNLDAFFATHPVFSLGDAASALGTDDRRRVTKRLRYHLGTGRLSSVAREVYAVVPPGADSAGFQPDPLLVVAALRTDAVIAHHAALELVGAGHSVWTLVSAFTARRRAPLVIGEVRIELLGHPQALQDRPRLATRQLRRQGVALTVTAPERTLVEGFRDPARVGGFTELVESAAGFGVLDLGLLQEVLAAYDERRLWAATGWFLERYQERLFVPGELLDELAARRPATPQYLARDERGGRFVRRWNLVLPEALVAREPDEPAG